MSSATGIMENWHLLFYLDEPIPSNHISAMDGNKYSFAFSFANLLKIWLKCTIDLDENQAINTIRGNATLCYS